MTTYHDVPADLLIAEISTRLQGMEKVSPPDWADYAKTGSHRERPPVQADWWYIRSAAVLRKVGMLGPIGANHMAQQFGGPKDRGVKQNRAVSGSRNIARTILQQLSACELITSKHNLAGTVNLGKILTSPGQSMLDDAAQEVRSSAEEKYPGLSGF
jgi:small subunit ribosomal protein S19e